METHRPFVALYGYRDDDKMVFLAPGMEIEVKIDDIAVLEVLLAKCNGYKTAEQIAKEVSRATEYAIDDILDLLDGLREQRVIVDSHKYFQHLHRVSSNPAPFMRDVSDEEAWQMAMEASPLFVSPLIESSLTTLLQKRVSSRDFDSSARMHEEELKYLFWTMYGRLNMRHSAMNRGTVPSAGALYPTRLSVMVNRVDGLQSGIYQLHSSGLVRCAKLNGGELAKVIIDDADMMRKASVIIVISSDLSRMDRKYSNRGYRYALIEAGHVAQNAYLWCAENNFKVLEFGGFFDEEMATVMRVSKPVVPLLGLAVGR